MPRIYLSLAAALMLIVSGCKNDSESAMSSMVDKMKEIGSILKGVKDKDSAAAAKPKLESIYKEMVENMNQYSKKKPNEEEMKKAGEKYKAEFEEAMKTVVSEQTRIAQIPGAGDALGGPMGGFGYFGFSGFGGAKFK